MNDQNKILLVEDDPNLGSVLTEYLELKGYEVNLCENGALGYSEYFKDPNYDILILDVMMPEKDGFTLASEIREKDKKIPIIFLTARSMKEDRLEGFKTGADDYITKPFSMEELLYRVKAVLRRTQSNIPANQTYQLGKFTFEYNQQMLKIGKKTQKLTTKEAELFKLLCSNVNELVTRENALKQIWGDDDYFKGRSMDVFITRIRKYLKTDSKVELMNVHGSGFKLVVKE